MKRKGVFYSEAAYPLGLVVLALGTALMEKANFGMSMVVAPAYLLHLKLSQTLPWFSFGMAEYCLQAVLLVIAAIGCRRFKPMYLLSFVTAVAYGLILDAVMAGCALLPGTGLILRGVYYVLGMIVCAAGVSLLFHTYFAPEAYELMVKELSAALHADIHRTKTVYDCISCAAAVVMSFAFFGFWHFEGVKAGTIFCALINGRIIGLCSKALEAHFEFRDAKPWRRFFA